MKRFNNRSAFTLLELLMVVIIIGILASLALPGYIKAVERARAAEVKTVAGQLRGAIQRFCEGNQGVAPTVWPDVDSQDPNTDADFTARWGATAFPAGVAPSPEIS